MSEDINVDNFTKFNRLTLVEEIQSILQKYPDDGQIFKEIIQNADDAGATDLIFIYDQNDYSKDSANFSTPGLCKYQGPALYVYNNANFTATDWSGIVSLGTSNKLKDPLKVGRFGLGFKSVFHLTDLPTIASGKIFAYLDPMKKTFKEELEFLDFSRDAEKLTKCDDFDVFKHLPPKFSISPDGICNGTLFRFALRNEESKISKVCYDSERFSGLIDTFMNDGYMNLLFLKRIQSVTFFKIKIGEIRMEEIYSLKLSEKCCDEYGSKRLQYLKNITKCVEEKTFPEIVLNHEVQIEEKKMSTDRKYSYIVSEYFGYTMKDKFYKMITDTDLSYIPLVAVALPVDGDDGGHIFCGLPLPLREKSMSGLPAHVNGFFALGPDRKDLKWKTISATESNDKSVNWNLELIAKLLPDVFYNLIMYLIEKCFSLDIITSSWPDEQKVNDKWKPFLPKLYQKLSDANCIFIEHKMEWVNVHDAFFINHEDFSSVEQYDAVCKFLEEAKVNVTKMPSHVKCSLESNVKEITKSAVQQILKEKPSLYLGMSEKEKCYVLAYVIQEVEDIDVVQSIDLLPLTNGSYVCIGDKEDVIYIPTPTHHSQLFLFLENLLDCMFFEVCGCEVLKLLESRSGDLNLILLDNCDKLIEAVKSNLGRKLENSFMQNWPYDAPNLNEDWLSHFWQYQQEQEITLEQLDGIHLIPVITSTERYLCKLSVNPLIMCRNVNGSDTLTCDMENFLQEIGILFLDENRIKSQAVHYLHSCQRVLYSDSIGVLQAIRNAHELGKTNEIHVAIARNPAILSQQLLLIMDSVNNLPGNSSIFCDLKLFQCFRSNDFSSIKECKVVDESFVPSVWNSRFGNIITKTSLKPRIRKHFDAVITDWSFEQISNCLFQSISWLTVNDDRNSLFDFVFDVMLKEEVSPEFINNVKSVIRVCAIDGQRMHPGELFFKNEDFQVLFSGEINRFADVKYNQEVLKRFGLKTSTADLNEKDIHSSIEFLCGNAESMRENALHSKVKSILEVAAEKSFDLSKFRDKSWIPVKRRKPEGYPTTLSWYGEKNTKSTERVSGVYLPVDSSLIGSSNSVVHDCCADVFQKVYGAVKPRSADVVAQLRFVVAEYNEDERGTYKNVINKIYNYFHEFCEPDDVAESLKTTNTKIWQGSCFVNYNQILLTDVAIEVAPYYHLLPADIHTNLNNILEILGCADNTEINIYINTLTCIAQKQKENNNDANERDANLAIELTKFLADHIQDVPGERKFDIVVPCQSDKLKLVPLKECYYHDFDESISFHEMSTFNVLHHSLGKEVADRLDIADLVSEVLSGEGDSIFESCGQVEPLTLRLNRLLKDYEDGMAIPKELIQNADDAGATEVYFLHDKRENEELKSSLFDKGMKHWQGPAIWVYNNAQFTENDFVNITKLNAGTKEYDTTKIGKFGLGFNAVYNLTDVPSFLSGNNMVIFDPHTKYLGKAIKDKTKPGIRIPLNKSAKNFVHFNDQFKVFHGVFGARLNFVQNDVECYPGTLFRLPLRNAYIESDIKDVVYDHGEVTKLFKKLEKSLDQLLLFTENVKVVKVFTLQASSPNPVTDMKLLFSVEKSSRVLATKDLPIKSESMLMNVNYLLNDASGVQQGVIPSLSSEVKTLVQMNNETVERKWFVSSCAGSEESFQWAKRCKGYIPCGGIAIDFTETPDGNIVLSTNTNDKYLYCFLPLPESSHLPVHVNGAFEVSSDRKQLTHKNTDEEDGAATGEWNNCLSRDIGQAYFNLLLELTMKCPSYNLDDWLKLLPQQSSLRNNSCIKELCISLVEKMLISCEKLFPCNENGRWCAWKDIRLLCKEFDPALKKYAIPFMNWYYNVKLRNTFVCLLFPLEFYELLEEVGFHEELNDSSIYEEQFIESFFQCVNGDDLDDVLRNDIVFLFLKRNPDDGLLKNKLSTTRCIPTLPSGNLNLPSELIKPKSKAAKLYDEIDEVFPVPNFNLPYLELLGMESQCISWKKIIERAKKVESLNSSGNYDVAVQLSVYLIPFIEDKLAEQEHGDAMNSTEEWKDMLLNIPFIPAKRKSEESLFSSWTSDEKYFGAPSETFGTKYEKVACVSTLICDHRFDNLLLNLGTSIIPSVETVTLQLKELSRIHGTSQMKDPRYAEVLDVVYEYLTQQALDDEVFKQLCSMKVIYSKNNELVTPETMYFEIDPSISEIPGYMYELPVLLSIKYKDLMLKLNVKETCDVNGYIDLLARIEVSQKGTCLTDNLLKSVVMIFNLITDKKINVVHSSPIFLPDKNKIMRNMTTMCYKDQHWLPDDRNTLYAHEDLLPYRCSQLEMKASRKAHFARKTRGIPFGQQEELTTRIRNLLRGYSSPDDVLKEMLQNADDAGATEVEFILDERCHGKERIFSDYWKDVQGPALLVANNGIFTEENLHAIKALGQGDKSREPLKTGKYGVGFNAVYAITDCPSFLTPVQDSEDVLVIFDPNLQYVESVTKEEPGVMFEKAREELENNYTDVKKAFLFDEFDSTRKTLFRLPLRNAEMAEVSKIRKKATTVREVQMQLKEWIAKAHNILLFLNHVKILRFKTLKTNGKGICETFEAFNGATKEEDITDQKSFEKKLAENLCNEQFVTKQYKRLIRKVCIQHFSEGKNYVYHMDVIEQCGFSNVQQLLPQMTEMIENNELCLLPKGAIAAVSRDKTCVHCSVLGFEEKNHEITKGNLREQVFCCLSLPMRSNLELAINGYFVLDYETRRNLWSRSGTVEYNWNCFILVHCILPCFIEYLKVRREYLLSKLLRSRSLLMEREEYYKLFPFVTKDGNGYWNYFSCSFYQHIFNENLPCLIVGISGENIVKFTKPQNDFLVNTLGDCNCDIALLTTLKKAFVNVDVVDEEIVQSFSNSKVPLSLMDPTVIRERLIQLCDKILPKEDTIDVSNSVFGSVKKVLDVLEYCFRDVVVSANSDFLESLPLCLSADNKISAFSALTPKIFSEFSDIFENKSEQFVHKRLWSLFTKLKLGSSHFRCLENLTLPTFVTFLNDYLPADVYHNCSKPIPFGSKITHTWLKKIWQYLFALNDWNQVVADIGRWSLLPLKRNTQLFLYRVDTGKSFLFLDCENRVSVAKIVEILRNEVNVYEAINKISESNGKFFYIYDDTNAKIVFGSVDEFANFVDAMHVTFTQEGNFNLSVGSAHIILNHVSTMVPDSNSILFGMWSYKPKLRQLPLYERMDGTVGNADGRVTVLPSSLPDIKFQVLEDKFNRIFLKESISETIRKWLDLQLSSATSFFLQYVFRAVDVLCDDDIYLCVLYIKNNIPMHLNISDYGKSSSEQEKANLSKAMSTLKFMSCGDGTKKSASEIYDPAKELFRLMKCPSQFPPQKYEKESWLPFLRKIGLIQEVDANLFKEFAQNLEQEENNAKLLKVSQLLCRELHSNEKLHNNYCFLVNIKSLPFLVPEKIDEELELIHPSKNVKSKTICFENSASPECSNLVWTTKNIIPTYAVSSRSWMEHLQVTSNESLLKQSEILNNMRNITEIEMQLDTSTCRTIPVERRGKYVQVLVSFYKYLQENKFDVNEEFIESLSCILVDDDKKLDIPAKTVLSKMVVIKPYLNDVSERHGLYFEMLRKLGCTNEPTLSQYVGVIEEVQLRAGSGILDPNELMAVKKAVCHLSNCDQKIELHGSNLYLPTVTFQSEQTHLTLSTEAIYSNDPMMERRLFRFPEQILTRGDGDNSVNKKLVSKLAADVKPKLMSDVLDEVLCDQCQRCDVEDDHISYQIKVRLRSLGFLNGLDRLIEHERKLKCNDKDGTIDLFESDELFSAIKNVEVDVLYDVKTRYNYKNVPVPGSEKTKDLFLKAADGKLKIILSTTLRADAGVYLEIATALLKFFKDPLQDSSTVLIVPLLLQHPLDDIPSMLDRRGISQHDSDNNFLDYGSMPKPGDLVPSELYCLLKNDFCDFEEGEYIAIERQQEEDETLYEYAIIRKLDHNPTRIRRVYGVQTTEDESEITDIGIIHLYRFDRECTKAELTLEAEDSLENIAEEIKQILAEAKFLSPNDLQKVIQRLYLKWHPNMHSEAKRPFINQVFEALLKEIEMIDGNYSCYFGKWNSKAHGRYRCYQEYRTEFNRKFNASSSRKRNYVDAMPTFRDSDPQPVEAKRWLRQAQYDLDASVSEDSPEWKCFKAHQAAEKALKAANFQEGYERSNTHNLRYLSQKLSNDFRGWASNLEGMVKSSMNMRYPDRWPRPNIPHEQYNEKQADAVYDLACSIVSSVEEKTKAFE